MYVQKNFNSYSYGIQFIHKMEICKSNLNVYLKVNNILILFIVYDIVCIIVISTIVPIYMIFTDYCVKIPNCINPTLYE